MTTKKEKEDSLKDIKQQLFKAKNEWPFMNMVNEIGDLLYSQYMIQEEKGENCGTQMLEWIKDRMWGRIIQGYVPTFNEVWDILNENGNVGKKNEYTYGDIDVGVWIEPVKEKGKKVIASTRYCSCADDNTHLYIVTGLQFAEYEDADKWIKFLCRTVWPRQKKGNYDWGDDRTIRVPSIRTYRDRDFNFSYQDCRDKGHVFTYDGFMGPKLDNAHWHENRIPNALQELRWHLAALKDYEKNRCM